MAVNQVNSTEWDFTVRNPARGKHTPMADLLIKTILLKREL